LVVSFDRDSNDFWGTYLEIKMKPHDCMLISLYTFENRWCLNCPFMSNLMLDPLLILMMVFVFLSMLMTYEPWFVWKFFLIENRVFQCLWVSFLAKPSRDFTRPLGSPRSLKGLLHTLNAIVSPTKADLCFLLWFYFFILFC
jgi:hypothetical protein